MTTAANEICWMTATELARRLRAKELSAVEVLDAHLAQIERMNPQVNAIVTLVPEQARAQAQQADERLLRGEAVGPLHGLPIAHKDLVQTKGIRTTFGSPIYHDFVPDEDELIVERIRAAGAITLGKTNVPEFGAGSQTFNPVFGATRNPYDLSKTCGGSSGGAAVALACGMLPIADGSDMGGSLRNPAGYCNIVGLRPSPGRVPSWPTQNAWQTLSVDGPLGRTVGDVALLLSAIAGPDPRSPIALPEPGERFAAPLERDLRGLRVAWSRDLGGLPVDPHVTAVLEAQRATWEALGCVVEDAEPDLSDADEIFKVLRAWSFELGRGTLLDQQRDQLKDTVIWNIEQGRQLTSPQLSAVARKHSALFERVQRFFEQYSVLICPVSQVPPFDVQQPYPTVINDEPMETYIDWMRSCYYLSVTAHPSISVPCGFTPDGLPVGMQIVGRYRDEFALLQIAHAFEQATGFGLQRPALV